MWNNEMNFKLNEPFSKWNTLIPFSPTSHNGRFLERPQRLLCTFTVSRICLSGAPGFCGLCRGKGAFQRNTLAVDHHHSIRSFVLIGGPTEAPFFCYSKPANKKGLLSVQRVVFIDHG
jgi:hypothetical protein